MVDIVYIQEIEELGGMAKAIETGIPKGDEEAAVRKQARIDSGKDTIVGVNAYKLEKEDQEFDIFLEVDNTAVREAQINRLNELKENRNPKVIEKVLKALTHSCETEKGNLLALAVEAARAGATLEKFRMLAKKYLVVIKHK